MPWTSLDSVQLAIQPAVDRSKTENQSASSRGSVVVPAAGLARYISGSRPTLVCTAAENEAEDVSTVLGEDFEDFERAGGVDSEFVVASAGRDVLAVRRGGDAHGGAGVRGGDAGDEGGFVGGRGGQLPWVLFRGRMGSIVRLLIINPGEDPDQGGIEVKSHD